jgi:hypothetical protein
VRLVAVERTDLQLPVLACRHTMRKPLPVRCDLDESKRERVMERRIEQLLRPERGEPHGELRWVFFDNLEPPRFEELVSAHQFRDDRIEASS